MVNNKLKIIIVDDVDDVRANVKKLLSFAANFEVIAEFASGEEMLLRLHVLKPDVILMDINMPGMDGIKVTEAVMNVMPSVAVVIMSVQGEHEYLRRAMIAGAKNYLVKPFNGDELAEAIKVAFESNRKNRLNNDFASEKRKSGKVITIFSSKGGIGKTTIATNLAITLGQYSGGKVAIVDANLQFGDVALFLNIDPVRTIADWAIRVSDNDSEQPSAYMAEYGGGLRVMAAPIKPEQAEFVTATHIASLLQQLKTEFDYIVVDTSSQFSDVILSILDISDRVFVVSALDLPTIKNIKLCLELMSSLGYGREKVEVILNRANAEGGMNALEVEETLKRKFDATLPSDGRVVLNAVNRGVPFVISHPEAQISQSILNIAAMITEKPLEKTIEISSSGVVSRLRSLFGY